MLLPQCDAAVTQHKASTHRMSQVYQETNNLQTHTHKHTLQYIQEETDMLGSTLKTR